MKNSILILLISLASFTNICKASNTISNLNANYQEIASAVYSTTVSLKEKVSISKPALCTDNEMFNPETVIRYNNLKPIKEVITEDDKVTENTTSDEIDFMVYEQSMKDVIAQFDLIIENTVSNEVFPLSFERGIEDEIIELEIIIDSTTSNETRSLDFNEINKKAIMQISIESKIFVGMN